MGACVCQSKTKSKHIKMPVFISEQDIETATEVMWNQIANKDRLQGEELYNLYEKTEIIKETAEEFLVSFLYKADTLAVLTYKEFHGFNEKENISRHWVTSYEKLAEVLRKGIRNLGVDKEEMMEVFKYVYDKITMEKLMDVEVALNVFEILVMKNEMYKGDLAMKLLSFIKNRGTEVTMDEWSSIPLFLYDFNFSLKTYKEDSHYPRLFDELVRSIDN